MMMKLRVKRQARSRLSLCVRAIVYSRRESILMINGGQGRNERNLKQAEEDEKSRE